MKGKFITIEGPDGSGKSTVIEELSKYFIKKRKDIIYTREPGGTPIGEKIRDIILDKDNTSLGYETEALLYAASRAEHINGLIEPALREGKIVISDRFLLSSLAYQGIGRDLGIERVREINNFGLRGIEPDLILFFYIDPETSLERKFLDRDADRLELEGRDFHKKVYEGYISLMNDYPERIVRIDARGSIEEVTQACILAIENIL